MRKPVTFRFDDQLLERAKLHAQAANRSLTNYVETAVLRALERSEEMPDGVNARRISSKLERASMTK